MKTFFKWILAMALVLGMSLPVYAGSSYSFSRHTQAESPCPSPYYAEKALTGTELGVGEFHSPQDLFYHIASQTLYIVDTGNSRIVTYQTDSGETKEIKGYHLPSGEQKAFNQPGGIFVTDEGVIAVADTGNHEIVVLNADLTLKLAIDKPESEYINDEVDFQPQKVLISNTDSIYCIAAGINDGMLEFGADGYFVGFSGANKVVTSVWELFWKKISSQEMNEGAIQYVPTEFSNLALDEDGFIYTTTASVDEGSPESSYPVRKQSTAGNNILAYQDWYYPSGDINYPKSGNGILGPSTFVDVAVNRNGMYHCLDSKRGRIFTYDKDGNMLFACGGPGDSLGRFNNPTSIVTDYTALYVLDAETRQITVLMPTHFSKLVFSADDCHNRGLYEDEEAVWAEVLKLNANYEVAYTGMGRALLCQGREDEALSYFKIGQNRTYYSKAYKLHLQGVLENWIGPIIILLLVCAVLLLVWKKWLSPRLKTDEEKKKNRFWQSVRFAFYCMVHPFDGFYRLKREREGTIGAALLFSALTGIALIVRVQLTGFSFNYNNPEDMNILLLLGGTALLIFLWCIANWSITTLMSGEGKFLEIFIASAYALLPYSLIQIPLTIVSNVLTLEEASIYTVINVFSIVWVVFLMFSAMQQTHQYTSTQTVASILLTVLGIAIILFLATLFFNLIQQLGDFVMKIYNEIIFRI